GAGQACAYKWRLPEPKAIRVRLHAGRAEEKLNPNLQIVCGSCPEPAELRVLREVYERIICACFKKDFTAYEYCDKERNNDSIG
ncbi:hypothetical protein XELAEV_18034585mg, partial [Xenopus laevis]